MSRKKKSRTRGENYNTIRRRYSPEELQAAAAWKNRIIEDDVAWTVSNSGVYLIEEEYRFEAVQPAIVLGTSACDAVEKSCSVDVLQISCGQCGRDFMMSKLGKLEGSGTFGLRYWGEIYGAQDLATTTLRALLKHMFQGYLKRSIEWDERTRAQSNGESFVYEIRKLGIPQEDKEEIAKQVRAIVSKKLPFNHLKGNVQMILEMLEHPKTEATFQRYTYDPRFECGVQVECDREYVKDIGKQQGVFEGCTLQSVLFSGPQMAELEERLPDRWEKILRRSFRDGRPFADLQSKKKSRRDNECLIA